MIELTFWMELMLTKEVHQKSVMFVNYSFQFQPYVCNRCHDLLLMMSINLAILLF